MKLPEKVFKNISDNYYRYFTDNMYGTVSSSDSIRTAISILKLLDLEFKNGIMYDLTNNNKPYKPKNPSFTITPYELRMMDEDDLNRILNKNGNCALELLPLFDCIGYTISKESNRFVLCFIGSPKYELWKTLDYHDENDMKWQDLEDDYKDINLSKIDWNKK